MVPPTSSPAAPVTRSGGRPIGSVLPVVVLAAAMCMALSGYWFGVVSAQVQPGDDEPGQLISSMYDPPSGPVERALVRGDGQLFAGQATDPLAHHTEMVRGGQAEEAYRYQRPLYGWLGWIASGGQRGAVAVALIVVTGLAVTALVGVIALWLAAKGADPRWALVVLAMPGVFVDLTWVGPEALGVALVLVGLQRWMRVAPGAVPDRLVPAGPVDWWAVALLAAAGLARETFLLVPFVLMVAALLRRRTRLAAAAAAAAVPYVAWVLYLRVVIGAWPRGSVGGRLSVVPFGGMVQAWGAWGGADWFFAAALLALAAVALAVGRTSGLRPLVAANLAMAATLGQPVWHRYADFGRVLLLMGVLSLVAVAVGRRVPAPAAAVEPGPAEVHPAGAPRQPAFPAT